MTKTKETRPGTAATVQSANPKDQLHSTTEKAEIQDLCNIISADLANVRDRMAEARVLLNDQNCFFFSMKDPVTGEDRALLAYEFPHASIRQDVINNLVLEAADRLADIMERLETELAEGRERDEG